MTAPQNSSSSDSVSSKRLWFGLAGAVFAWVLAGLLDFFFAWRACMGGEAEPGAFAGTGLHILLGFITFGFLAVAIAGGIVSYGNWRKLSDQPSILFAEGRGRKQFMAIAGVLVSVTLGVGMVWFSIPIYVLGFCTRWR